MHLATLAALLLAAPPSPIAASVNGRPITAAEVEKALRDRVRKTFFHRQLEPAQVAAERGKALDGLVVEELRAQEARRRGLAADPAPARTLAAAEQAAAGGPAAFDAVLAANGIDRARYREVIERPALAARLVATVEAAAPAPTPAEVAAEYRAHLDAYLLPAAARLRELCLRVEPYEPEPVWEEARKKAAALRARLVAGADFAAAAREAACDRFAADGGDLGLVHQGSLDAQLDAVAFALRAGEISAPVRTPRGWHLLRCEAVTPARQATLAEVERSVAAGLLQRRRAALVEELDARLRREATVVVRGAP